MSVNKTSFHMNESLEMYFLVDNEGFLAFLGDGAMFDWRWIYGLTRGIPIHTLRGVEENKSGRKVTKG